MIKTKLGKLKGIRKKPKLKISAKKKKKCSTTMRFKCVRATGIKSFANFKYISH